MYLTYDDKEIAKENLDKIYKNMERTGDTTHSSSWSSLSQNSNGKWFFEKPDLDNCKNFDPEKLMSNIEFDLELEEIEWLQEEI